MPPAIGIGAAALWSGIAGAGATAATGLYAAHKQGSAAKQAGDLAAQGSAAQLDYIKQKDAQDQANWERTYQQQLADYRSREGRAAPYRQLGSDAVATIGSLLHAPAAAPVARPAVAPTTGPRLTYDPQSGTFVQLDPSTGRKTPVVRT